MEAMQYRTTQRVSLIRMERFCRALERALTAACTLSDSTRIWRLYVSAECPVCGIQVCGNELRALAFDPCAEMASAKIGRMRLGDCARSGCGALYYSVHFWNQEEIDWRTVVGETEEAERDTGMSLKATGQRWLTGSGALAAGYAVRAAAVLGLIFTLWLAREFYLGGRIPFLREPEKFRIDTTPLDATWPAPMDGA